MSSPVEEFLQEVGIVHVHVTNTEDFKTPDKPAEVRHTVTRTFTDIGQVIEVLELDPLRDESQFFISGAGTVYICHSLAQAQAALLGVGGNFGAQIVCPGANVGSIRFNDYSQGRLWAVMTGASPILSVITQRKG